MRKFFKQNGQVLQFPGFFRNRAGFSLIIILTSGLYACKSSTGDGAMMQMPPQTLPVITVSNLAATTYQEFPASLEGSKDIEVRPQVEGYLDKIYVDEGAHVRKGQPLFQINSRPYIEQLNNAKASLSAARANLATA